MAHPPTSDVGFFLYAAGRMLDGARLYRDVVDLNPPLIFALNIPVVLLARVTGLSEILLYRLGSALLLGVLLLYSGRLLVRHVLPDEPARARYVVLLLCFACFALPGYDFGEREHFVLALLVPYLLLVAADCAGRKVPTGDAIIIGVLAGAAIALKPPFGLVWIVLEVFRRLRRARADRWRSAAEVWSTLGFLGAYAAALLLLTPDYLAVARLLGPTYARYAREPFVKLLVLGPGVPLVAFALLAYLALRQRVRPPTLAALVASATLACLVAGAAQEKEFRYHFYPAMGLAFVLLGLVAVDAGGAAERLAERIYGRTSRALLATVIVIVLASAARDAAGLNAGQGRQWADLAELVGKVRALAGGRPVGVLSYTTGSAFPLANYARVSLASRFPSQWPLAAEYWDAIGTGRPLRYRAVSEMGPAERFFLDAMREDLAVAQPRLLILLPPARDVGVNGQRRLHFVLYLSRDPQLASLLGGYRLADSQGEYLLYVRAGDGAALPGPPPSAAPGTQDVIRTRLADIRLGNLDREWLVSVAVFMVCWWVLAMTDRRRRRSRRG